MTLLYSFRFLNSQQIQEFLGHKDHRRINSWLKDLTNKEYVIREFNPVFGTLTKPAVYYLSTLGRKHIKNSYNYYFPKYLKRIARDNKASKAFKIRCQILADFYLTMKSPKSTSQPEQIKTKIEEGIEINKKEEISKGETSLTKFSTGIEIIDMLKTSLTVDVFSKKYLKQEKLPLNKIQFFTPAYFPDFELLKELKPDGYMRKKTSKGLLLHAFIFVIDAYVPRFLLRYTLKNIFEKLDEYDDDNDQETIAINFYFICPNHQIIIYLRRLLPSYFDRYYGKELIFNFATRNQLYKHKNGLADKVGWIKMSSEDEYDN